MESTRLLFRRLWARALLRGVQFSDRQNRIDHLYRVTNPWNMDADAEQFRFRETNRLISSHFGHLNSVLEIGCGEGHQSEHLLEISDRLYGVDLSSRAIARARIRCPGGEFAVGEALAANVPANMLPFSLVTACEVLYYMKDLSAGISALERLGESIFVTYVNSYKERLNSLLSGKSDIAFDQFSFGDICWTAAWWRCI